MKIWTLALSAALTACSGAPGNNVAAGNQAGPAATANSAAPGLSPVPERPAVTGELACVTNRLSPAEREALGQYAAEQGPRDDPRGRPVRAAVDACAAEHSWSQQKRAMAGMYALTSAGEAALRRMFEGRGIDLSELDRAIVEDRALMAAAEADGLTGSAGQEFAMRHSALINRMLRGNENDQMLGVRLGNYIAFRALAEMSRNRFGSL